MPIKCYMHWMGPWIGSMAMVVWTCTPDPLLIRLWDWWGWLFRGEFLLYQQAGMQIGMMPGSCICPDAFSMFPGCECVTGMLQSTPRLDMWWKSHPPLALESGMHAKPPKPPPSPPRQSSSWQIQRWGRLPDRVYTNACRSVKLTIFACRTRSGSQTTGSSYIEVCIPSCSPPSPAIDPRRERQKVRSNMYSWFLRLMSNKIPPLCCSSILRPYH